MMNIIYAALSISAQTEKTFPTFFFRKISGFCMLPVQFWKNWFEPGIACVSHGTVVILDFGVSAAREKEIKMF